MVEIKGAGQIAALFPGQGSQHVGMGKELYVEFAVAREVFEEASDATHLNLKKLCFESSESDLKLTENTQPCLLTVSVASLRVAEKELGFVPAVALGHSLGEYSALVATGSIQFSQAARWVRVRGLAMQEAVPAGEGAMAAVLGLSDDLVESLCKKATAQAQKNRTATFTIEAIVEPVNYNAPNQLVIAGSEDAVSEALLLMKTDAEFSGGKVIPLPVSAPFHSSLMKPAREKMEKLYSQLQTHEKPGPLRCPYVPNRTARLTHESSIVLELLIDQIDHPVLWKQSMTTLLNLDFTHAIEFGPGKVLQGLAKRITQPLQKSFQVLNLSEPASLKAIETLISGGNST